MKYIPQIPEMVVVHCSATQPRMDIGVKEIDFWHRERGWFSCGYHYIIRRDGTLEKGRPDDRPGAHARGYNKDSLGICLVGGIDDRGRAEDNFTVAQYNKLYELLLNLVGMYKIHTVIGHGDLPHVNKACPSFDVQEFLSRFPRLVADIHTNGEHYDD